MSGGCFVAIVGPSGAGKDSLIAYARQALAGDSHFMFVRRMVTRAGNAFEDHDTIDRDAFAKGHAEGSFALSWLAHGLGYAVPADTVAAVEQGAVAICNLSRAALSDAQARFPRVQIVSVTVPVDVLATRLAARGRETAEAIAERLNREGACDVAFKADLTLRNDRALSETGEELVAFLRGLRQTPGG